jgi:hypothetical protein
MQVKGEWYANEETGSYYVDVSHAMNEEYGVFMECEIFSMET